jgi:hypothetical protein
MSDNWHLQSGVTATVRGWNHGAGNWTRAALGLPPKKQRSRTAVASRRAVGATALVVVGMWATGMLPGRPAAASVVVHSFGAQNSTGSATLAAPATATSAGDLLIATIRTRNVTAIAPVTGVTDSNGEHWQQAGTSAQHGNDADGEIWYMANAAALNASQSVTVTVGGTSASTSAIAFTVLDVTGMATVSPLDVTAPPTSGNTQPSKAGPTPTTTQASDLVVAALGWNGNGTTTSGTSTGYTADLPIHQATVSGAAAAEQAAYQVLSATGVQNYQATLSSTTAAWTGVMATFKVSTGPPPPPTITSFSPTHGVVGTSVIIAGTGFTGATSVKFGGTSQPTFTVNGGGTQITTTVPAAAPSGVITVATPGGTVDTSALSPPNFTVDSPPSPTITAFSPTSGSVGTSVTVTGTGFTGATAVKFNATNQPAFTVNGPGTQITTTVPTGATTGQITVTTGGGTANTSSLSPPSFTVNVAAGPPHIMLIVEENESFSEIVAAGTQFAPYINGTLRPTYPASWVTNWFGVQHNSPYDYVELLSGVKKTSLAGGGFTDPTLVDELHSAGIPWLAYMENLSAPCKNTGSDSVNLYDVNHNPFHYYKNYSSWCTTSGEGVIPYPGVSGMLSTLNGSTPPAFVWISPNDCNEMHGDTTSGSGCSSSSNNQLISAGDLWLKNNIGPVLASQWFAQNGTVIVTWDEAAQSDGTGCCGLATPAGGHVATLVLSHNNNGSVVATPGDHYGTLATIANAFHVSASNLGQAGNAANGDLSPAMGTLSTPGSISGTVKDAVTTTGIAGATVCVSTSGTCSGASTVTASDGTYTLSNVAPGTYEVTASAANYAAQSLSGVVVTTGNNTSGQNFTLQPNTGSITGTVTDFQTGLPLSGATVCTGTDATCATFTYKTTTAANGTYTLSGVTEGTYQVNALASNYVTQSVTGVAVTPGGSTPKNFALVPNPGSITGKVTSLSTGLPISSATVCISTSGTCTTTTTSTASDGTYTLNSITEGSYQVTAMATGYASQSFTVNVTPGSPATQQNFSLSSAHQPVFSDGFESNSFSAWTSSSGLTVENTAGHVHSGTYAAEGLAGSGNAVKLLPSTYTTGYERVWFNIESQTSLVKVLQARTTGSGTTSNIGYVLVNATTGTNAHDLALNVNGTKVATATTTAVLPGSGWHELEMSVVISGTTGAFQVWLDGVQVTALTYSGALGATQTAIGQMQIGDTTGSTWDVAFDDAAFDTQMLP